jgi:hypothetical protein
MLRANLTREDRQLLALKILTTSAQLLEVLPSEILGVIQGQADTTIIFYRDGKIGKWVVT